MTLMFLHQNSVNALLEIRGDLDAMELYYDIELPEASQDVNKKVQSLINTEETRIRQFAYLVTTNSFYEHQAIPILALVMICLLILLQVH